MNIEFYTNSGQFKVIDNCLYHNGKLLEKGKIGIHHLILDEDAWLTVDRGEDTPCVFIRTDKVYTVNPNHEFYDGKHCTRKNFLVRFQVQVNGECICCERTISAVCEQHVRKIVKREHQTGQVHSITVFKLNPLFA